MARATKLKITQRYVGGQSFTVFLQLLAEDDSPVPDARIIVLYGDERQLEIKTDADGSALHTFTVDDKVLSLTFLVPGTAIDGESITLYRQKR